MVSHDIFIAPRYLDSALLLDGGKVIAHDAPEQALSTANITRVFGPEAVLS